MKFLIQFLIIIAFSFLGELLHYCLPLPIPASIYGIVLLFIALELKWVKVKDIRETSSFLIAVMPVMFIPAAVGLIDSWASVSQAWFQYIIVTVISTFIEMGVSGMPKSIAKKMLGICDTTLRLAIFQQSVIWFRLYVTSIVPIKQKTVMSCSTLFWNGMKVEGTLRRIVS